MYLKIKLLLSFLLSILIVECSKYKFDYYYTMQIDKINENKFPNSNKIIINKIDFYIGNKNYETLMYMGTGILPNGTYINMENENNFYTKEKYAIGSNDNKLEPWISIADKSVPYGTKVYISIFDKLNISISNTNFTHNGCFRVDDITDDNYFIRIFTGEKPSNANITNISQNTINIKKQDNCILNKYNKK